MLFAVFVSIMCLHPAIDRKLSTMYDKYQNDSLDDFDNCDYVYSVSDVMRTDLVVMQINIRGIGSKRSQLIDLIDNSVHAGKHSNKSNLIEYLKIANIKEYGAKKD